MNLEADEGQASKFTGKQIQKPERQKHKKYKEKAEAHRLSCREQDGIIRDR